MAENWTKSAHGGGHGGTEHGGKHSGEGGKSCCDKLVVAAIDFGTTYSGYAFSFKHEYEKECTKVSSNNWTAGSRALVSLKTPTTLLLKPDKTFEAFGYEAEDRYADLALDEEHGDWYYFRRFKMMLFEKIGLKRNIEIEDDKGRKMNALTVFTMSIKYLKEHLLNTLGNRASGVTDRDVHWVLTVPAIWNDNAKQFMREAAEKAGINGKDLSIALEPEAASVYCMRLPVDMLAGAESLKSGSAVGPFSQGVKYMVVDIGGGTVDITVHEVLEKETLREVHKASGGAWGGTRVDEAFKDFFIKIVGPKVMRKFELECTSDFIDMFREFETKKRNIKQEQTGKVTFKVPIRLAELFEELEGEKIKAKLEKVKEYKDRVTWVGDKLRVEADVMKSLFNEPCGSIIRHVDDLLRDTASEGTNTIVLVGGFSESTLLQEAFRRNFKKKRLIIPEEAGLAVLKGAVMFGHNPLTIISRVARYSYGVRVYRDFKDGEHPTNKKMNVDGVVKCKDIFGMHVKKGDELKVGEVQSKQRYTPLEADQTSLVLDFYTSTEEDPKFVTDVTSQFIGQLEVQCHDLRGGKERGIWVEMTFSGTEIIVAGRVEKTNKVTQTRFNCLG